jgi:GDP-L-fucose synthase
MADACVYLMNLPEAVYDQQTQPMQSHLNVGFGSDISIRALAAAIARIVGYTGAINVDPRQPDGTPRKLMDSTRLNALGWQPAVNLEQGLAGAYADFLQHHANTLQAA